MRYITWRFFGMIKVTSPWFVWLTDAQYRSICLQLDALWIPQAGSARAGKVELRASGGTESRFYLVSVIDARFGSVAALVKSLLGL